MGLYTFLYENLLYRLYFIRIQPARIVTARLSRYTAHTAYTAIQPYTPYIIQRYTASLRSAGYKSLTCVSRTEGYMFLLVCSLERSLSCATSLATTREL